MSSSNKHLIDREIEKTDRIADSLRVIKNSEHIKDWASNLCVDQWIIKIKPMWHGDSVTTPKTIKLLPGLGKAIIYEALNNIISATMGELRDNGYTKLEKKTHK
jgi:hypothetical protein